MTDAGYELPCKIRRNFKLLGAMSDTYLAPLGITTPRLFYLFATACFLLDIWKPGCGVPPIGD